ncbi:hypothetical protein PoB_002000900 [Plakobranchus ocellatus]|uniref:Uncharacterized protein n=1 Tax=Plakobranchus ocellatus TaxID=259542 RepID=A0AAV3ZHZ9_9GAST|nr:hypothetical protein PoB_002000900 [Plakobranchus ocellatus]
MFYLGKLDFNVPFLAIGLLSSAFLTCASRIRDWIQRHLIDPRKASAFFLSDIILFTFCTTGAMTPLPLTFKRNCQASFGSEVVLRFSHPLYHSVILATWLIWPFPYGRAHCPFSSFYPFGLHVFTCLISHRNCLSMLFYLYEGEPADHSTGHSVSSGACYRSGKNFIILVDGCTIKKLALRKSHLAFFVPAKRRCTTLTVDDDEIGQIIGANVSECLPRSGLGEI